MDHAGLWLGSAVTTVSPEQGGQGTTFRVVQTDIHIPGSPFTLATQASVLPQPFYTLTTGGLGSLLPAPLFSALLPNMFARGSQVCMTSRGNEWL